MQQRHPNWLLKNSTYLPTYSSITAPRSASDTHETVEADVDVREVFQRDPWRGRFAAALRVFGYSQLALGLFRKAHERHKLLRERFGRQPLDRDCLREEERTAMTNVSNMAPRKGWFPSTYSFILLIVSYPTTDCKCKSYFAGKI